MPVPKPWTEEEVQGLLNYALHVRRDDGLWAGVLEFVPSRTVAAITMYWRRVLQRREPTDIERQVFAVIYKREKGAVWNHPDLNPHKEKLWANMGTLADRERYEGNSDHWYFQLRKKIWNPIAREMNIAPRVVETMFFMLSEEERAV